MSQPANSLALGLVQMCSAKSHAANIAFVDATAQEAAAGGCQMLALPEVAGMMNRRADPARDGIRIAQDDPFIAACQSIAIRHRLWIHIGSTPVAGGADGRLLNHSVLVDAGGQIVAAYSKIHLFDIMLNGRKPILESSRYAPGTEAVLAQTQWGPMGMSICYDLRFPGLYRDYAHQGARAMFIPSAFTVPTGAAHWEVLLRARAIETGSFVIAAAQSGPHEDGRETYGHSMVIDPWGQVLADMADGPGWMRVDLDLAKSDRVRSSIPALRHDRTYSLA